MLHKYKLNTFDDFYKATQNLKNKEKGDLFEELTKCLFLHHPTLMKETDQIWMYNDFPEKYKKHLKLPTNDEGIDLMMLSKDQKWYAIQSKFRTDKDKKISWDELSTFAGLTFGVGKGIYKGIFVTNTVKIHKNLLNDNFIIVNDIFDDLGPDFFNIFKPNKSLKVDIKKPRAHQINIIEKTLEHFENHDRGYLEISCGGGKTLAAFWINSQMNNKITIITVPSLYLLSQFSNDWMTQSVHEKDNQQFILVGSDMDSTNEDYNKLFLSTNSKEIVERIKIMRKNTYHINIITTYQSSYRVIEALTTLKIKPDFCIFDEAHKTVAMKDKQFNLLLNNDNLFIKKRLFMTATPKVYQGENNDMISMNDVKWYGEKIYLYNTYNAITDGQLSDYQIVTMHIDNLYVKNCIKKNKLIYDDVFGDNQSHYVASAILLLNALQDGQCHHLLTYHNNIAHAQQFTKLLEQLSHSYDIDLNIFNMDGKMSMNKRKNIINDFTQSKFSILASAKVLNEGINIPIIDSVCFIDGRGSTIDIVQCVGRALRKHPLKDVAKIFIPILIEDINKVDESKIYGNAIKIIKNLAETDTGIVEYFISKKKGEIPNRALFVNHNYFGKAIDTISIDLSKWIGKIEYKIWTNLNTFNFKRDLLFEYCDGENVLTCTTEYKNVDIGSFLHTQKCNITGIDHELYIELSKNEYVKANLDKFLKTKAKNKSKTQLTQNQMCDLLLEYCDGKNILTWKTEYKGQNIGGWLRNKKEYITSVDNAWYIKLSKNDYIKANLDEHLKNKEIVKVILTADEWRDLLFEYSTQEKGAPIKGTIYKGYKINGWFHGQKSKINSTDDELYKILSKNEYIKISLDEYLKNKEATKEKNKNKTKLTQDDMCKLLLEYCNGENILTCNTEYKNQKIGPWWHYKKSMINGINDAWYVKLSKNKYLKNLLDEYLQTKEINKDKVKLTVEEWRELLFEYSTDNECAPVKGTVYKGYNINRFLKTQKSYINSVDDELYKILSKNIYIKKSLDEYLKNKEKDKDKVKLSEDEMIKLLFEYCDGKNLILSDTNYKDQNIGGWFKYKKEIITSINNEWYIKLSKNKYLKEKLDESLKKKIKL